MVLSERNRYAAVLAAVAAGILVVGYWLRPLPKAQGQRGEDISVTRAELENLQQLVRRNSLRHLSSTFENIAQDNIAHLVSVQPWGVNAVLTSEDGLIIPKSLESPPQQLTLNSGNVSNPLHVTLWTPGIPFAISKFDATGLVSPARVSDSTPAQGEWVVVVANGVFGQNLLSPGIYNGVVQENCGNYIRYRFLTTVPLNQSQLGGGLFDLAGALQGVVLPCEDGPAAIPISEVKRAIAAVNADPLLGRYGMRVAPSADNVTTLVTEVWDSWSAGDAGFEPGDTLISVDGQKVTATKDAIAALLHNDPAEHEVDVRRGSRTRSLNLVRTRPEDASMQPALSAAATAGVLVGEVATGSSAADAGIKKGDRILRIDGRLATNAIVQRTFAQYRVAKPASVVVQKRGCSSLVVVKP
jgi:S1-C subfamily serine protease